MDFNKNLFSGNVLFHKFPREKKPDKKKPDVKADAAAKTQYEPPVQDNYQPPKPEPEPYRPALTEDFPISEPTTEANEQTDDPNYVPYQLDSTAYDTTYKAPKKKRKFKIPRVKFGRKTKKTEPAAKESNEDKWFWLKYAWRERGLGIDLLKGVFRSMGRFIHRIRTDFCNIDLSLGTGDPMTTALAVGGLESTLWILRKHGRVEIAPLYDEQRFDFAVSCSFSMRPYQAVSVLVWYLVTLPWVRMVRVGWDVKGRVFGK
jgi:hypothetical protein